MTTLDLHEINSRNFNGKTQDAVILKLRSMFDLEGVELSHINDALWDSRLRILYTSDLSIIRFSQQNFKLFLEILIKYQEK